MRAILSAAAAGLIAAIAGTALAQQGRPITQEDVQAAQALFAQLKPACIEGSTKRACGVLAYAPEDCSAKKKDAHIRHVYGAYEDGTVRFQQGNAGVARQRPIALLAPFAMIARNGEATRYANPRFVSWDDYQAGKKSVIVCGKTSKIEARDFTVQATMEKFLKNNP